MDSPVQDVDRRIYISIHLHPALRALERLTIAVSLVREATFAAGLAGVSWVDIEELETFELGKTLQLTSGRSHSPVLQFVDEIRIQLRLKFDVHEVFDDHSRDFCMLFDESIDEEQEFPVIGELQRVRRATFDYILGRLLKE